MLCSYNRLKVQMLNLAFQDIMLSMFYVIYLCFYYFKQTRLHLLGELYTSKYLLAQNCVLLCCFLYKVMI